MRFNPMPVSAASTCYVVPVRRRSFAIALIRCSLVRHAHLGKSSLLYRLLRHPPLLPFTSSVSSQHNLWPRWKHHHFARSTSGHRAAISVSQNLALSLPSCCARNLADSLHISTDMYGTFRYGDSWLHTHLHTR